MSFVATCHCGAVKVEAPRAPTEASRCNCTYCYRTGAVWTYYRAEELKVSSSVPLGDYAPSTVNHHHFCTTCGGNTHGISPDWHSAYNEDGSPKPGYVPGTVPEGRIGALNLNMVLDFDLGSITVRDVDGRNNW
jgi:hypothetical protein